MTSEQESKCHAIIHTASAGAAAAGGGLAQAALFGADSAVIVPIQIGMIISFGVVFGKTISKTTAKSILKTKTATAVGRKVSSILFGWMPGIGNVINATTAAGVTEALGWYVADAFDNDEF